MSEYLRSGARPAPDFSLNYWVLRERFRSRVISVAAVKPLEDTLLIRRLVVRHFRSAKNCEMAVDPLTVLIGRNGAGKSTLLRALEIFYNPAATVHEDDFYSRDTESPIEIQITYGDLTENEEAELQDFARDGQLIVTKRHQMVEGRIRQAYFVAVKQIAQFATIRQLFSRNERRQAWRELVDSGELSGLSGSAPSAEAVERAMTEYELVHPELMELSEREETFFGPPPTGGGRLDVFTKFVLVPAVRDVGDELGGRRSAIHSILETLVLRKLVEREEVRRFRSEFAERAKSLFSEKAKQDLDAVATSLSERLGVFAPGSSLNLAWGDVVVPEVNPPPATVTVIEDAFEGDIGRKGHGLQRALVLTLLHELARLGAEGSTQDEPARGGRGGQLPTLVLAVEEPELFLHPSRCRYLARVLLELSGSGPDQGPSNQVIYSTHSPHFADLERFDQIRRLQKVPGEDAAAPSTGVESFSLEEAAEQLEKAHDKAPGSFTRASFQAHALPVMSQVVNEGFFADVAVLVEGTSELGALWKLQALLGHDWAAKGIAVIPVGGKNSLDRPAVAFRGLSIPTYLLFDGDSRCEGTPQAENVKRANHACLRLVEAPLVDFPNTQVHAEWAVLSDNFETLLEDELGAEAVHEHLKPIATELGYESETKSLKIGEVASRLIESVYGSGLQIPTLEKVVAAVSELSND